MVTGPSVFKSQKSEEKPQQTITYTTEPLPKDDTLGSFQSFCCVAHQWATPSSVVKYCTLHEHLFTVVQLHHCLLKSQPKGLYLTL